MALLELHGVSKSFGGLRVIQNLDLAVEEGEIVSLIGPNGAGKTTVFNLITGVYTPDEGTIILAGENVVGLPPHRIATMGAARTFQSIRLFLNMSVRENVMVAGYGRTHTRPWQAVLRTRGARVEEIGGAAARRGASLVLREAPRRVRLDQPAYSLSYANRRRLEIARAMATRPRVLLLDEPAAGMNPHETHEITELTARLRDEGGFTVRRDRARHARRRGRLGPRRRARPRHRDRGGLVRVRRDSSRRDRGLSRQGRGDDEVTALLRIDNVTTYYGEIRILEGVSIEVGEGEVVCLLGGNASGKSTTLKTALGLVRPRSGSVELDGEDVTERPTAYRIRRGMAIVPENRRVFAPMTVSENLEMGAHLRDDDGIDETRERVHALFPRLYERRAQLAGTLSGGEQQMLAMGRALMSRPRLLLMDEPSMGLAPALVEQNFEIIREVNASGVAVLVVEQNANMALSIADRGYVLQTGVIALADKADALLASDDLKRAYLGR